MEYCPCVSVASVVIEAMACGAAVVATMAVGVPEVICSGVNGLLVRPDDYEGMREAVRKLILDPALRARLAHAGERSVKDRFAPEKVLLKVVDIYEELSERTLLRRVVT